MARIRTIKPDFWTDEKVVELSAFSRLLFIGLWNFADDSGRMVYSPKKIKMQIFPADSVEIPELVGEIRRNSLVTVYVVDGIEYLQINGFEKHQKIDKRSPSKLPPPPDSPRIPAELPGIPTTEGNGREGIKEGNGNTLANAKVAETGVPACPHLEIIEAYHRILPMGRRVNPELWNGTRAGYLKARWREDKKRQTLEFWERLFTYISESKFLTGQVPPPAGKTPFEIDLEWIVSPGNFAKIYEGKYHK